MGALGGSLSYLRFFAAGEPAKNPGTVYERAIEARRFRPMSPGDDVSDSAGWVPTEAPFDDELPVTRELFLFGSLVAVTYREDKWAIPRPVLRRAVEKKLREIEAKEKKSRDEMNRGFKKAIELAALSELKAQTIPRTKLVDVVWDLEKGEARVFGRGTIATERVASLFERTFQVRLDLASYAARAFTINLGDRAQSVLERLSPGWMFPEAVRHDPTNTSDEDAA